MDRDDQSQRLDPATEEYLESLKQKSPERLEEFVRLQRLGEYLRECRESQAMSGREVARRLGVSPNVVSEIETGKKSYPDRIYEGFADVVRANQDHLFSIVGRTPLYLRRFFEESTSLQSLARLIADHPEREALMARALEIVSNRVKGDH